MGGRDRLPILQGYFLCVLIWVFLQLNPSKFEAETRVGAVRLCLTSERQQIILPR